MKNIITTTIILFAAVLTVNAQNNTQTAFDQTLKAYFETKNALAKDDVSAAGTAAKNLLVSVKIFPAKNLSGTQSTEWNKQAAEIVKFATPIVKEKDLKLQRKSFENVSSAMLKLTRTLHLNSSTVYVQYCPMVKRSWLNEVEAVQNPFYGSKMYDCGEVTETLAKK